MKSLIRITKIFCRKFLQSKIRNTLTVINMGVGIGLCLLIASTGVNIFQIQSKQLYSSNYLNLVEVYKDNKILSGQNLDSGNETFTEEELQILSKIPNVDGIRVARSNSIQLTRIGNKEIEIGEVPVTSIYEKYNFLFSNNNKAKSDNGLIIIGRELKSSSEIVVTQLLIQRLGIKAESIIGKNTEIQSNGVKFLVKVVGIINDNTGLMFDPTKYQNVFLLNSTFGINKVDTKDYEFDTVTLYISDFEAINTVAEKIESLNYRQQNYSKQISDSKNYFKISTATTFIISMLLLMACIWVLKISLTISLDEKLKFIGLLKAMGFRNLWVRYLIVIESISLFFVSAITGLGLSQLSCVLLKQIVNIKSIFGVDQNVFLLNPFIIVITFIISLFVCLCFCIYPCKVASKVSVLEIMKADY